MYFCREFSTNLKTFKNEKINGYLRCNFDVGSCCKLLQQDLYLHC